MVITTTTTTIDDVDLPGSATEENSKSDSATTQHEEDLKRLPPWTKQITARGVFASLAIGIVYSIVVTKLNLTTGLVPNLNVSAALLAFVFVRTWTKLLEKAGFVTMPFTRQENTIIQTAAVACYSIAVGGGFGSYLLALDRNTYEKAGFDAEGNSPKGYKVLKPDWMIGFCFVVSFVGLLALVPLRKIMIIDYKLPYPSGTATAVLINGFHTAKGDKMAKKQVHGFMKFFSLSFVWSFFQWFYSGGKQCGFMNFPTFGLKAWRQTFYFDFSMTYVGAGMICSHIVNLSLLLGAVLSYGIMWPLISEKKGVWFPQDIKESSMKSLSGYKVFIAVALILGDGLYNFVKTMLVTFRSMHFSLIKKRNLVAAVNNSNNTTNKPNHHDHDARLNEVFLRDGIPLWVALSGYALLSVVSTLVVPAMFPQLRWPYVLAAYALAPALGFCNAYASGLTDMNMANNYGKVALFVLAALTGPADGVVVGLVGCGLVKSIALASADLVQDLKTAHLTLASPRAMLAGQAVGTAVGCVVGPLAFFLFYKTFEIGDPNGAYKAPYAAAYRSMAALGAEGFSALPDHCLHMCIGSFVLAVSVNLLRDAVPGRVGRWVPLPMAMAVPFLVGGYFAVDMFVGSLVVLVWGRRVGREDAEPMVPAVASGLICGDGLWVLPSCVLAMVGVSPPICMSFLPGKGSDGNGDPIPDYPWGNPLLGDGDGMKSSPMGVLMGRKSSPTGKRVWGWGTNPRSRLPAETR
ncbi:Metal-nicotianamine transporter YSL3 [Striga hermonthica]|uniref:Metal-nicotianamine transporter YSL3 n=1 Tax=Striga hermonthica TaxID=68872 RepID=A0A9N7R5X9_STRHE|nr:Metal-nicotianamine transporter YSL3 [Striga hermonthica]